VIAVVIALFAGCAAVMTKLNSLNFNVQSRKHLQAIPVSKKVCPYVRLMHVAANDFQSVNPAGNLAVFAQSMNEKWPEQRARLAHRLDVLDSAVVAGKAHFPEPIRRRFSTVITSIRAGEVQLVRARDLSDLLSERTDNIFTNGEYAFGDASDLVGNACGFHLAADPQPS
jgi:hypothetical protein